MKKQIIITDCKDCPYSEMFCSTPDKKYCGKLTNLIYLEHYGRRQPPILPDNTAYIPKEGILKECPLNDI